METALTYVTLIVIWRFLLILDHRKRMECGDIEKPCDVAILHAYYLNMGRLSIIDYIIAQVILAL